MENKKILTVQDISCVGQCSLTVALPILSACGIETCVLPSAVLSTHTAGFTGYTFHDLTDEMPAILSHWKKEGIVFDAIYTGYLGSVRQIELVDELMRDFLVPGGLRIVDPAMADNGKLYPAFDEAYVTAMAQLCKKADLLLPNITEACFLTQTPQITDPDPETVGALMDRLSAGHRDIVLTGVGYRPGHTGVEVLEKGTRTYYEHSYLTPGCHGTGDVYASAFTGAVMAGKSVPQAARIAADYTVRCIEYTHADPSHWYGVRFEPLLPELIRALS